MRHRKYSRFQRKKHSAEPSNVADASAEMIGCSFGCFSARNSTEKKMPGPEAPKHQKLRYQRKLFCSCVFSEMSAKPRDASDIPTRYVFRGPCRSTSSPYNATKASEGKKDKVATTENAIICSSQHLYGDPADAQCTAASLPHWLASTFSEYNTGYNAEMPYGNPPIANTDSDARPTDSAAEDVPAREKRRRLDLALVIPSVAER